MTRSLLAPSDLPRILAAQAPTTQVADLLRVVGASEAARQAYEAAWQQGDIHALATLVCLDHVSSIANPEAPLSARALQVIEADEAGRITRHDAEQLLGQLIQLAAFRLQDFDEATRLAVSATHRYDLQPMLFAGLAAADLPFAAWEQCLEAIVVLAEGSTHPADRHRLLLAAATVGAELGRTELEWYERLIRAARGQLNEIFLFFLLRLLDRVDNAPSELSRKDMEQYLGPLSERLSDPEERFAYRLRLLDTQAKSGAAAAAIEGLKALADGPAVDGRAAALERCQRSAVASGMAVVAAEMATTRARRSADSQLKHALWLLAEELHRLAGSGPSAVLDSARELANFVRRNSRSAPGVLEHAYLVIEAVALQGGLDDELLSVWDERELLPGAVDQTLRRALFRSGRDDLIPKAGDVGELLSRIHAGVPSITLRTVLALSFIAEGWNALSKLDPNRFPEPYRADARQLKAYCVLLKQGNARGALAELAKLTEAGDQSTPTFFALYLAAERAGELSRWLPVFRERAKNASTPHEARLFGALEAAAEGECGDPERGLRIAQRLQSEFADNELLAELAERLEERQSLVEPIETGPATALQHLEQLPQLSALVSLAEQEIASGDAQRAADLLSQAAQQAAAADPGLAAALYARAGAVLGGRPVAAATGEPTGGAEEYLTRALELQPENASAWRSLCCLYSRRGRHADVARLITKSPATLDPAALPLDDLRRSARALKGVAPDAATTIYRFIINTAGERTPTEGDGEDLDALYEIARDTREIPSFRDFLEAQVVDHASGPLRGELNYRLGVLFADELRDVDLAVEHLRRALNESVTSARSSRRLRTLLQEQERWEELVEVLLTAAGALEDPDEIIDSLSYAADIQWDRLGRPRIASEALERLLQQDPKHLKTLRRLADYYRSVESWEREVELLERAARLVDDKRERSQVYQRLGEVYQMHLEKPNQALEHYLVSFMCDSGNRETFDRLEKLYTATERHKELAGILNIAIETTSQHPDSSPFNLEELYARRAHVEFKYLSDPQKAAESLVQALRINPSNHRYLRLIEGHLIDEADADTILQAYEAVASSLPSNSPELPELIRAQAAVCERLTGRGEQAIDYYERLLELDPADKNAFAKLEAHHRKHGHWDALIALYQGQLAWVNKPEQTVSLYHRIARIYESQRRDLPAAAATYADLLKLVPASISALRGLGRLYEAMRRWDDLIDVSEREMRLVEDDRVKAHLLFKVGSIFETHRGEVDKAIDYYQRAVDHDPRCVPALHGLRDIFQRQSRPERVIEYLEREADIWENPRERASIHSRIAEVYWESLGDADQAITHLERALELVPDSTPALGRLFDIYYSKEKWAEAAPLAYELSKNPERLPPEERAPLFRRRGIIASQLGNRREAIESLKIALDISPNDTRALERLAHLLDEEGDADAHAEFFARLQREFAERQDSPGLARVKRFLGLQAENRSNLADARRTYAEAIELDHESVAALRDLVRVEVRERDFATARRRAAEFAAVARAPRSQRAAHVIEAQILLDHLGARDQARTLLEQVLAAEPDQREALFLLAQAAFLAQDWPAARRAMETLVQLDSQDDSVDREGRAEHVFYLGRILEVGFDDLEQALSCYARAREEYPVDPRPLKAALLVLFRQRNWHRLDGLLDRALRGAASSGGEEATVPLLLFAAKLLQLRDDDERAHSYLKRLLELEPDHAEARGLIIELLQHDESEGGLAQKELTELLESNVFDAEALYGLAQVHSRQGEADMAACFQGVLELLGDTRGRHNGSVPAHVTGGVLATAPIAQHVHPAIMASGYFKALVRLGPELPRLGLERPVSLPSKSQRLSDADSGSLEKLLIDVMTARPPSIGMLELYEEGPRGVAVSAIVADRPKVMVELATQLDSEHDEREARFMLGHAVELLASGTYAIQATPRADLTSLLWWLARWARAPQGDPPGDEAPWVGRMSGALIDDLRALLVRQPERFERVVDPQHAQRFAIQLEDAATTNSDRMGLLLCGDLKAAVGAILKMETGAGLEMVRDASDLARSKRVTRLVRYAVSEPYFSMRRVLLPAT